MKRGQQGMMLLEALLGILLFSVGILGLIGLQSVSIKNTTEARFRSEAGYLANQIVGRMWSDRANLASYALTTATTCSGAATQLKDWLCQVESSLPGITTAAVTRPSIAVDTTTNTVTVTLHWRMNDNPAITDNSDIHNYVLVTRIN
jgi:type IV pilus assembly protein PilV